VEKQATKLYRTAKNRMFSATELMTSDKKLVSALGRVIYFSVWLSILAVACVVSVVFLALDVIKLPNKKQEVN
jgi:hypothetical protein